MSIILCSFVCGALTHGRRGSHLQSKYLLERHLSATLEYSSTLTKRACWQSMRHSQLYMMPQRWTAYGRQEVCQMLINDFLEHAWCMYLRILLLQWVPQDALSAPISYAAYSCNSQLVYATFSDGNIGVFDADSLRLRCRIAPSAYLSQAALNG